MAVGVDTVAGVGVGLLAAPVASWVLVGTATLDCASGQGCRFTGKSVHELASVQILSMTGVFSGPLQSTTCFPLFTSIVEQLVLTVSVVVVVVVGEVTAKVAVSGRTSKA